MSDFNLSVFDPSAHLNDCVKLWNSYVESGEVVFKPVSEGVFTAMFLSGHSYKTVNLVTSDKKGLAAFASGNFVPGAAVAYISYVGVRRDLRGKGAADGILKELEQRLAGENPALEKIELVFFNPCQLPWYIPSAAPHDHPGTPGVDMESAAYPFFKRNGYSVYAQQNGYYLPLADYKRSDAVAEGIKGLEEMGIEICYYNKDRHFGFSEFFDNIQNEGWRAAVMPNLDKDIVIAADGGRVVGYTGPLSVSESGRGMFSGIGVHTEYRRHGIGNLLFATLCLGLSEKGARFMSLFTGTTNPARRIYEGAGFKIVRGFADMRKTLK